MEQGRIIIFTAVRMETRAVERALAGVDPAKFSLHTIGIKAGRLPPAEVLEGGRCVIMAGLAGALDPTLRVGDVIIEDEAGLVPDRLPYLRGRMYSAEKVIATPVDKAALFQETGAIVVEMENRIVQKLAQEEGKPFVAIRAVSDSATEVLDPAVLGFIDELGNIRPIALGGAILRRPGLIPYLNRLGNNSKFAANKLGQAVRDVVQAMAHQG